MKIKKLLFILLVILIQCTFLINAVQDSNLNNNNFLITINVTSVRALEQIIYVPIDELSPDYEANVNKNHNFIEKVYPVKDNAFNKTIKTEVHISGVGLLTTEEEQCEFIKSFFIKHILSGTLEYRVIGVVGNNWFNDHGFGNIGGYTCNLPWVAILNADSRHIVAHEIGHTYGLCDEYNNATWSIQDTANFTSTNLCPNGDGDNNNELDSNCLGAIKGCPAFTDRKLDSYLSSADLKSIMGSGDLDNLRWMTKSSYNHLLDQTKITSNLLTVKKSVLISGIIYKNGSVIINPIYSIENMTLINRTSFGNYSIFVSSPQNNFSRNFTPDYSIIKIDGNTTELNKSNFVFLLPVENNSNSIQLFKNGVLIKEINVSLNVPTISINSIDTSEPLSIPFNITWNASDLDNDNLYYAILISPNNGSNYTTLVYDYTNTSYEIDPNDFEFNNKYMFKILVTDGVNTNYSFSNVFTMGVLPSSLGISSIQKVYSNNTLNVFEFVIQNNASATVTDIYWTLDTGDNYTINSTLNISSLVVNEQAFVYVAYNYSDVGTYNIAVNATGLTASTYMTSSIDIGDLIITSFDDLDIDITKVVFEIQAKNNLDVNITNANWSLAAGDGQVIKSANQFSTIKPSETIFIFVNYDYGKSGTFSPSASVTNGTYSDSKSIILDVKHIEAYNLSVVNESGSKRIFEFIIKNSLNTNLTNVSWIFDTKNSNVLNSTMTTTLQPSEQMFVYIDYNFTTTGTFNVNASARNGTLIDYRNLTITVS